MDKESNKMTNPSAVLESENTYTGTITTNPDGTVKENFAAVDDNGVLNNKEYSTTPKVDASTITGNTGTGLDAAEITKPDGTTEVLDYSWNTKASDRANLDYKAAVLESKANYLTNRQELEVQGHQNQETIDMQKYSQNQSAEKAGWTGGYILDTERQMNYLKQTIQSQMYGAMELQRYGYDTSLAAARLAYDTQKYDLALEYYNTALSRAVTEAELTGYYIAPEVAEHLNQYSIASKNLNEGTGTERDEQIINAVYKWFEANGVSKQGVETLARQDFIFSIKEAAKKAANFQEGSSLFKVDLDSFGEVGADGKLQYTDDYEVKLINFNEKSAKEIIDYANRGEKAKQQVLGYMEGTIMTTINNYLDANKVKTTDSNAEPKYTNLTRDEVNKYLSDNLSTIAMLTASSPELMNNYSYSTRMGKYDIKFTVTNGILNIDTSALPVKGSAQADETKVFDENNKLIGYSYSSTDELYDALVKDGYKTTASHTVIDVTKDLSEWGDAIKQTDLDAGKSKNKAGAYVEAIRNDAKAGKIDVGKIVTFNYGSVSSDENRHMYVYVGDNKFAKLDSEAYINVNVFTGMFENFGDILGLTEYEADFNYGIKEKMYVPSGYYMERKEGNILKK